MQLAERRGAGHPVQLGDIGDVEVSACCEQPEVLRHLGDRFVDGGLGAEVSNARERLAHGRCVGVGRVTAPGCQAGGHAREVGGFRMAPAHRGNGRHQRQ